MIGRVFRRTTDWREQASAFVDGELPARGQAAFRRRLDASAEIREYVRDLQDAKAALGRMPDLTPRRSYTLSPALAATTRRSAAPQAFGAVGRGIAALRMASMVSSVAVAALVAVIVVDMTQDGSISQQGLSQATVAAAPAAALDQSAPVAESVEATSVAALPAREEAEESATQDASVVESQSRADAVPPESEEQATADSGASAAPTAAASAQAAAPPEPEAEAAAEAETAIKDDTESEGPTTAIAASAPAEGELEADAPSQQAAPPAATDGADADDATVSTSNIATAAGLAPEARLGPEATAPPDSDSGQVSTEGRAPTVAPRPRDEATADQSSAPPDTDAAVVEERAAVPAEVTAERGAPSDGAVPETRTAALEPLAGDAAPATQPANAGNDDLIVALEIIFAIVAGVALGLTVWAWSRRRA